MSAIDWFWTGRNNAVDLQRGGISLEVGMLKVLAYWIGYSYGCVAWFFGVRR